MRRDFYFLFTIFKNIINVSSCFFEICEKQEGKRNFSCWNGGLIN